MDPTTIAVKAGNDSFVSTCDAIVHHSESGFHWTRYSAAFVVVESILVVGVEQAEALRRKKAFRPLSNSSVRGDVSCMRMQLTP
jgi:hypothetical protein